MLLRPITFVGAAIWLLAACAVAEPPASEARVMVRLSADAARAQPDAATIADWASRSVGAPVRYAAAVSPQWHALALRCQPADCAAAMQRLAADTRHFDSVEVDGQRRPLSR